MKEQRREGEGGTLGRETERLSLFGTNAIDRVRAQPSEAIRTTDDSDRSIVDRARIEVQAKQQACPRECRSAVERAHASRLKPRSIVGDVAATLCD